MSQESVLAEVVAERQEQDRLWGGPNHDDGHDCNDWIAILVRHLGLAANDEGAECVQRFRRQMIRVAAVAVAVVESFDRKAALLVTEEEKKIGTFAHGSGF